jgi:PIN domain nuclease of toxin-antitoxin system
VRALIDVQAVLWHMNGDPRLPPKIREWLASADNERVFSAASAWEVIIKAATGKLQLDRGSTDYVTFCIGEMVMERLPITYDHVYRVAELPPRHGDPFDRILVAQAMVEGLPIVTGDATIARYGVKTIW